jgi:hypothetical protein
MHDSREPHLIAPKWILRYVHGTFDLGLCICASSQCDLVVYLDVDWVGCPNTHRSTSSYVVFLVTTWSLGPPSARTQSPVLVLKLSTML